jgi:hypothetical protein
LDDKQELARPEDKALLRSNLSAAAGDRADGQGCFGDPAILLDRKAFPKSRFWPLEIEPY